MRVADAPMGNSKKTKPRLEGGGVLSRDGMIALNFLCGRYRERRRRANEDKPVSSEDGTTA